MANFNLRQTGDEVQKYINSIPVIDVTGTQYGKNIVLNTNPYSQLSAIYSGDCKPVVRLTVGTDAYIIPINHFDGVAYKGTAVDEDILVFLSASAASASAGKKNISNVSIIEVSGTSDDNDHIVLSPNPHTQVAASIDNMQHVVLRISYEEEYSLDVPVNAYIPSIDTFTGEVYVFGNGYARLVVMQNTSFLEITQK